MHEVQKIEHLLDMISQFLIKGMVFRPEDLVTVAESRMENPFKVTRKVVESLLDELVREKSIMRMINGSYGAHERNNSAICAALERFVRANEPCSRKEIRLKMQPPVTQDTLDRLLRNMVKKGRIVRTGWSLYSLNADLE